MEQPTNEPDELTALIDLAERAEIEASLRRGDHGGLLGNLAVRFTGNPAIVDQVDILDLYEMVRERWEGLDAILAALQAAGRGTEEGMKATESADCGGSKDTRGSYPQFRLVMELGATMFLSTGTLLLGAIGLAPLMN